MVLILFVTSYGYLCRKKSEAATRMAYLMKSLIVGDKEKIPCCRIFFLIKKFRVHISNVTPTYLNTKVPMDNDMKYSCRLMTMVMITTCKIV